MSNELKPCPFCGGKPYIKTEYDMDGFGNFRSVECSSLLLGSIMHCTTQAFASTLHSNCQINNQNSYPTLNTTALAINVKVGVNSPAL